MEEQKKLTASDFDSYKMLSKHKPLVEEIVWRYYGQTLDTLFQDGPISSGAFYPIIIEAIERNSQEIMYENDILIVQQLVDAGTIASLMGENERLTNKIEALSKSGDFYYYQLQSLKSSADKMAKTIEDFTNPYGSITEISEAINRCKLAISEYKQLKSK